MKKDKFLKPVYEPPKVFSLDETESGFGQQACDPGSVPGSDCTTGAQATGSCINNGPNAFMACTGQGNNVLSTQEI